MGPLRREGGAPAPYRGDFPSQTGELEMLKKTYSPKLARDRARWFVVDAAGIPLGRLSIAGRRAC